LLLLEDGHVAPTAKDPVEELAVDGEPHQIRVLVPVGRGRGEDGVKVIAHISPPMRRRLRRVDGDPPSGPLLNGGQGVLVPATPDGIGHGARDIACHVVTSSVLPWVSVWSFRFGAPFGPSELLLRSRSSFLLLLVQCLPALTRALSPVVPMADWAQILEGMVIAGNDVIHLSGFAYAAVTILDDVALAPVDLEHLLPAPDPISREPLLPRACLPGHLPSNVVARSVPVYISRSSPSSW